MLTVHFAKQLVLEPDFPGVADGDVPADSAVEKSALEEIALAQPPQRMDRPAPGMGAAMLLVGRLRPEPGVAGAAFGAIGRVFISEMMEMPRQNGMPAGKFKLLMHAATGEARLRAAKKAHEPVGIPIAVAYPFLTIKNEARELVSVRRPRRIRRRIGFHARDGSGEIRRNLLVGVDAEHPGIQRLVEGEIFLTDVAEPVLVHDARAEFLRDLERLVRAAGIDDENLIDERGDAGEASRQVALLVKSDDAGGDFQKG